MVVSDLPLEFQVLLQCSRTELRPEHIDRTEALLQAPALNWGTLVATAGYHGVQALLYRNLRKVDNALLSEEHVKWLRGVIGTRSAHSLILVSEMGRLVRLLGDEGLPFIAVKGPVLALGPYGEIGMRPFVDLDLIIDGKDYARLEAVLAADGYTSKPMSGFQKTSYLYVHGQYSFWRRLDHVAKAYAFLDVHTAVMPPGYSFFHTFEELLERSQPMMIGGGEVATLKPEDLVQVLCFHGFKARWDRLKYVTDLAEVIRAYPELDWDEVYGQMDAMHSRRTLQLNLYLASILLDAPLPDAVRRDVLGTPQVKALGDQLAERMPQQAYMKVEPYRERVRVNMSGQDSLRGKMRYGAYAAVRRLAELYMPKSEE